AEAALDVRQPARGRLLATQEEGLERLHSRRRQQDGWIVDRGHERCRRHDQMLALLEEREVGAADVLDPHAPKSRNARGPRFAALPNHGRGAGGGARELGRLDAELDLRAALQAAEVEGDEPLAGLRRRLHLAAALLTSRLGEGAG